MTAPDLPVLILAPFKAEARLLAGILPDCRQSGAASWSFKGGRLATANAVGGAALLALLDRELAQASYRSIILFGAAGALAPELQIGQLFSCDTFFYANSQLELPAPPDLPDLPPAAVVTVDQPAITRDDRAQLAAKHNASLVDMESFFFAEAMQGRGLNGAVIRFVSDTAEQPFALPFPRAISRNISELRHQIIRALQQR
jgi:nucleoside phosphorylase